MKCRRLAMLCGTAPASTVGVFLKNAFHDLAKNFLLQDTVRFFQALKTVFLCPATPTSSVMRL